MANFMYDHAHYLLATGALDLSTADLRMLLVMTNTTADTERDKQTFAGFTTLDEFDGSGYSTGGVALTSESVVEDAANHRAELSSDPAVYTGVGVGTRQAQGAVLYKWGGSLAASIPIGWIDTVSGSPSFPFTANGSNVTLTPNAEGWLQV